MNIYKCNLKEHDLNNIFSQTMDLLMNLKTVTLDCMNDGNKFTPKEALELTTNMAWEHIQKYNSTYKRNKMIQSSLSFVEPQEKSVGTRWELIKRKNKKGRIVRIPRLIQCTLQYVPILNTLTSLFAQQEFREIYFDYNRWINNSTTPDTECFDKIYRCFNSGSTFGSNQLFQKEPNSIQIQLSQDDFEICNELQSKSNRHKISALYFKIQNLPHKYLSKLDNIYLVCLCNANDLKSKHTDPNNIWQIVVNELGRLETDGIDVEGYGKLRGSLSVTAFDNLGANVGLGFVQSFSSDYYCRHCETHKNICNELTNASACILRTKQSYDRSIQFISDSTVVNYKQTKGVRFYCALSKLKYFHILDNPTVDIMHDVNEGLIPRLIKEIMEYCSKNNICKPNTANELITCYDFGVLNSSNVPSDIGIEKRSLGQNAAQSICLLRHLPFIFHQFRNDDRMKILWDCVGSLLRICEIIFSVVIHESDVIQLEREISHHLETFKQFSGKKLIPKQHFALHYPSMIRTMGPLVLFNMMRSEAKHSELKTFRKATRNFMAINKSLAQKHQRLLCSKGFTYQDGFSSGVLKTVCADNDSLGLLQQKFGSQKEFYVTNTLDYNSYKYRAGLVIIYEMFLFQISKIFCVEGEYYFQCNRFVILSFDAFLNSIKLMLDDSQASVLICFNDLNIRTVYEVKSIGADDFIICDTLELRKNIRF